MAFLQPCTIVVEITPFGYQGQFDPLMLETGGPFPPFPSPFLPLTSTWLAGMIYTELVAEKENSLLLPGAASSNGIACQPLYAPLPAGDQSAAQGWCMTNKYCRSEP